MWFHTRVTMFFAFLLVLFVHWICFWCDLQIKFSFHCERQKDQKAFLFFSFFQQWQLKLESALSLKGTFSKDRELHIIKSVSIYCEVTRYILTPTKERRNAYRCKFLHNQHTFLVLQFYATFPLHGQSLLHGVNANMSCLCIFLKIQYTLTTT